MCSSEKTNDQKERKKNRKMKKTTFTIKVLSLEVRYLWHESRLHVSGPTLCWLHVDISLHSSPFFRSQWDVSDDHIGIRFRIRARESVEFCCESDEVLDAEELRVFDGRDDWRDWQDEGDLFGLASWDVDVLEVIRIQMWDSDSEDTYLLLHQQTLHFLFTVLLIIHALSVLLHSSLRVIHSVCSQSVEASLHCSDRL